jgi:NAD+ kinase
MTPPAPAEFRKVALIGKYKSPEIGEALGRLASFLREQGCGVLVEQGAAASAGSNGFTVAGWDEIGADADLAVILGGDGTLLHAARRLAGHDVPLVGVNQGRLGFLTDIGREDMLERIGELVAGHYQREQRMLLDAELLRGAERVTRTVALNDVVMNKGDLGRMIEFEVRIDGEFVYTQRSDGIILATPTGSTAYALSANGPILHPSLTGIALVPLCPHALSNRPITVSDQATIEIVLLPPHDGRVHFDGQTRVEARAGDRVRVSRSQHSVTLLHPPGYSYFAMLREKLRWSEAPKNP